MDKAPPPHRTQIPNIVDDLGLDPYERALYVHYKRVCGENQGAYCYEAVKTTAYKVKMSTGQVSQARKQLANRGLILVQDGRPVIVTVVNIWELNTAFYLLEHRPDVDGWTVEQVKLWLHDMSTDVHTVNVSSHNDIDTRSPDETILTVDDLRSPDETSLTDNKNMSSYIHTVKQRSKESLSLESNLSKESKLTPNGVRVKPSKVGNEPQSDAKTQVKDKFVELTNLPMPTTRSGIKFWWSNFGEILKLARGDPDLACRWESETVGYMQASHLTITSPKSIVGLIGALASGQTLQKASKNGYHGPSQNNPVTDPGLESGGLTGTAREIAEAFDRKRRRGRDPT